MCATIGAGGATNPQMEDRNGNQFEWSTPSSYSYGEKTTITDSAGRNTSVYDTDSPDPLNPASEFDTISWDGTGGATRTVTVHYAPLGGDSTATPLGPGVSVQTYSCLFSTDLGGASSSTTFNPWVVSSIVLPDGTSYGFTYDVYGEVASMTLPTGGRYTYTYFGTSCALSAGGAGLVAAPSGSSASGSGVVNVGTASVGIYRRVVERDEYANGGTSMTAKATFTSVAGSPAAGQTRTTAQFYSVNSDGSEVLLKTENHDFQGDATAPGAFPTDPTQYPAWNDGLEFQTTTIDPNLGTVQTRQTVMGQRPCGADPNCMLQGSSGATSIYPPHDPQICQVNTTLGDMGLGPMSGMTFAYDQYNNQTDMREFDFGNAPAAGSACPGAVSGFTRETVTTYKTDSGYISVAPSGPDLVSLPIQRTVYGSSGTSGAFAAQDAWTYDGGTIATASGEPGHDDMYYPAGHTVRGNVTTHTANLSSSVTASETFAYDQTGSVVTYTDFDSNQTTFSYTASANPNPTHVYPVSVANALDTANGWNTGYVYDQDTLKVTSVTDENSTVNTYSYADSLDRLTNVQRGNTTQSNTAYSYASAGTQVSTKQDQVASGDGKIQTETDYDLLGRPIGTIQYEAAGTITATQSYDGLGRVASSSSPARPGDGVSTTTYAYDALGRPLSVVAPDGSATNISYTPNSGNTAETATVTDPAGATRQLTVDGLGRISQVVEDPATLNYATTYGYDLLDDLTSVTQGSSQSRSFTWNMRGWLHSVTNPETGSTATMFSYDNNGNQTLRQDARGISTCYAYDSVNRLTSQTYYVSGGSCASNNTSSPATPNVSYSYDTGATHAHGRLVSISNTAAVDAVSGYDELGRITGSSQTIGGGSARSFSYTYNLADAPTQTTYPSGRTVTNSYDLANRIGSVTGALSGTSTPYVAGPGACAAEDGTLTAICYAASGAPGGFTYHNNVARSYTYNSLQQPTAMTDTLSGTTLFSLNYTFGASGANNGNPSQVVIGGSGSGAGVTQNYAYDKLNRLCAAGEGATAVTISGCTAPTSGVNWAQNLGYDRYGNMWQASQAGLSGVAALGWMPTASSQINAANNHLTVSGVSYDTGGGNQTTFLGTSTSSPIQYDAENRQVYVKDGLGNVFQYTYDGLGQRVSRVMGSGTPTNYVHDVFGNLAAEYNPPSAAACTTCYLSWDHLGSTRMVTDASGTIVARHDYLPFGVEIPRSWSVTDGLSPKYTGQDHDAETLLEFYQARYLAAGLGRFMSVDPGNAGADLTDPQSWNMYSYVRNSPLTLVDPSGLDDCDADDGSCGDDCFDDPYDASCGGDGGGGWPGGGGGGGGGGTDPNNPNGYVPGVVYPLPRPQVGPGGGGSQGNGFFGGLTPAAVGAGAGATITLDGAIETIGGAICVVSGACEIGAIAVGTVAVVGTVGYLIYTHAKDARPSTKQTHEEGQTRVGRDYGGEKGDQPGSYPRKPPQGWKNRRYGNRSGQWPPQAPRDRGIADGIMGR